MSGDVSYRLDGTDWNYRSTLLKRVLDLVLAGNVRDLYAQPLMAHPSAFQVSVARAALGMNGADQGREDRLTGQRIIDTEHSTWDAELLVVTQALLDAVGETLEEPYDEE